jgi:hypothetical protein
VCPVEAFRVVDRHHQRLEQQPLDVLHEAARLILRVERLNRAGEPFRVVLGHAGDRQPDRIDQAAEEPARIGIAAGGAQPHGRPSPVRQRLLEGGRLAKAGVGDEDHRSSVQAGRQSLAELGARHARLGDLERHAPTVTRVRRGRDLQARER